MGRVLSGPVVAAVGDDPRLVVASAACEGDLVRVRVRVKG